MMNNIDWNIVGMLHLLIRGDNEEELTDGMGTAIDLGTTHSCW